MIRWLLTRVKLVALAALVLPWLFAGYTYYDNNRIKNVLDNGVEATADIEGGTRTKRRRSGTSFSVNLAWKDRDGKPRTAEKVSISSTFANTIIRDDLLTRDTLKIKYLVDEVTETPIVLEDVSMIDPLQFLVTLLPVSILGGIAFFLLWRREKRAVA